MNTKSIVKIKDPVFVFIRKMPLGIAEKKSLASSLQKLETSFMLVALERYPHAVQMCCSAIESALKRR